MEEAKKSEFVTHLFICTRCSEQASDLRTRLKKSTELLFPKNVFRVKNVDDGTRCKKGLQRIRKEMRSVIIIRTIVF
jgi:hypothetical protein